MKRSSNNMPDYFKLSVLASALALAMGPATAADFYLAAKPFLKDLPISGGTTQAVPMWGYVEDTGGVDGDGQAVAHCYDIAPATGDWLSRRDLTCVIRLPAPTSPRASSDGGPERIRMFRIYLSNGLAGADVGGRCRDRNCPSRRVQADLGPTWNNGATGGRTIRQPARPLLRRGGSGERRQAAVCLGNLS